MLTHFPMIKSYAEHLFEVDSTHKIYTEECGNPDGIPALVVHGGPGGGCSPQDRCFLDPEVYRIILFDQRGCGRSTPHGELANNTTDDLIADMEVIREQLNISKWVLLGHSWGTTLSLLYAEKHPKCVAGMILRGVFLFREKDINWVYQNGMRQIFPDYWEDFTKLFAQYKNGELLPAYYEKLTGEDELARMAAAKAWALWEARCATLSVNKQLVDHMAEPHVALAFSRICCHYMLNKGFIKENQIMENIEHLEGIPGIIVHGRYDAICPLVQAWELHYSWPRSQLKIIRDAGHSAAEPGIVDGLIHAGREMARLCR